jgi:hypothetical protein
VRQQNVPTNTGQLLVEAEMPFMVMTMVAAMAVYDHHNLRLRRIRNCETEDEHEAEQNLFHDLSIAP